MPTSNPAKSYRNSLGFRSQDAAIKFFKAKDIVEINWGKIEAFNQRFKDIFHKVNAVIYPDVRLTLDDMLAFYHYIDIAYTTMKDHDIIPRLNNNGRNPEDVYYNWMRGYCVVKYFTPTICTILQIDETCIHQLGHDNLKDIETFSKSPAADLEIDIPDGSKIRIEIQSGFTGTNDIKRHKVNEARRIFQEYGIRSYVAHFDIYNGALAVIDVSEISENAPDWRENKLFEGQIVFSIPTDAFKWRFETEPPTWENITS